MESESIELYKRYAVKPIEPDIYSKFACFYHAMTELYDRGLTDMRSPHDKTEAYVSGGYIKSLSNYYSMKMHECVEEYIVYKMEKLFDIHRWKMADSPNYSAQHWIDMFEQLKKDKDEVICDMIKHVGRYDTKSIEISAELFK